MTSLLDAPPAGLGSRTPRIRSVPAYGSSAGQDCVDLAAEAGLILDGWQADVLVDAMGERGDRWAARDVGLVVGRQNGKNAILEARELGGLFLLNESLIIHTAHQYKTAHESFLRIRSLIENNDQFRKRVKSVLASPGKAEILTRTGQRLMFVARGVNGSVRGFSPDVIMMDEAYRLPSDVQSAMLPAISARPNPQLWYTSSAGFGDSDVLRRLRERGTSGKSSTLAYFEWSAPEGADPLDRQAWAAANPGYGIRIFDEAILSEHESLDAVSFARERLGIWEDDGAAGGFSPAAWVELTDADHPKPAGVQMSFGVATAPDRSWSAVAAAWKRADGLTHVISSDYRPGTAWVAERVADLRARYGGPVAVDMASRGVVPDAAEVSQNVQAQAHNALADMVEARTLRHSGEPELLASVRGARWKPSGDTRVLDRKGNVDISPLIAAALAVHGAQNAGPSKYEDMEPTWL